MAPSPVVGSIGPSRSRGRRPGRPRASRRDADGGLLDDSPPPPRGATCSAGPTAGRRRRAYRRARAHGNEGERASSLGVWRVGPGPKARWTDRPPGTDWVAIVRSAQHRHCRWRSPCASSRDRLPRLRRHREAAPRATPAAHGAPAAASAIVPGSVDRTSLALRAAYDVELKLNYTRRTLSAASTMLVTNVSGGPVDRLELNAVAARLGRLAISSLTVDGVAVSPTISDQTLIVPLGGILPDGASTSVRIVFRATARKTLTASNWLFTRTNGALQLYRWLPWISRATPFDRPNHGDPFVTVSSPSVRVRITTDRALRLATSGRRIATDGLTSTWLAENVRDFNVVASPSWAVWSRKVGPVLVRVYGFRGGNGPRLLSLAVRAVRRYQALMGPYPYPTFVVAETGGGSGMGRLRLI